jgi:hypothetical protein
LIVDTFLFSHCGKNVNKDLYANRAAAHLKLKQYADALADCESCLSLDGGNIKAKYRKLKCLERIDPDAAFIFGLGQFACACVPYV